MAKKKSNNKELPVDSLRFIYEVGDEVEVSCVIGDGDESELTKTPVRITTVGDRCLGVRIIGRSWRRRFVKECVINIENDVFRVVRESGMDAVIEEIVED